MTRRLFVTLCGLVFLVNFGRVVFAPLLGPLQTAFGVGPATVGLVASLVWIGTGLSRIPVGYLLTRISQPRIVIATGVLLSASAAVTAAAPSIRALQVGALAIGVASGAYFVAAIPLVGELYPDAVGRAVGVHGTASQIAAVVAPSVAAAVLIVASWREAFWVLSVVTLALTLALVVVFRRTSLPARSGANKDFAASLSNWRIILAGLAMIGAVGFVWQGLFNFYVSYLGTSKGLSPGMAATFLTVVFTAGVPAFWFGGRLADRLPTVPYILALFFGFCVALVALTFASSFLVLLVVTIVLGYLVHSMFPALDTYMLGTLPEDNRASAYAVFSGATLLVEAGGSGVVGALTEVGYSFDTVFRWFAVSLLVLLFLLVGLYAGGRLPTPEGTTARG
ncbi:MAG: MFS transporter [Halobacteriota archaeon]